eukprot:CAMPEP_0175736208 /NCGR_PEP_ID=MMETSP0097-20121207/53303_1 /TAXON_ID=311494 /ORGANISM="Alexandrium monilatum, Strain CCMP3105" /LENGTH=146 /DNA_ID=CAMNT_0017044299 /DNA_START=61 /DNA_END=501 /DNA_ORIENTATION=-
MAQLHRALALLLGIALPPAMAATATHCVAMTTYTTDDCSDTGAAQKWAAQSAAGRQPLCCCRGRVCQGPVLRRHKQGLHTDVLRVEGVLGERHYTDVHEWAVQLAPEVGLRCWCLPCWKHKPRHGHLLHAAVAGGAPQGEHTTVAL